MRQSIGIMGGSYNPVHIGHLMVADFVMQHVGLDSVLMMLSPMNPFKAGSSELIDDSHRMAMLKIACGGMEKIFPSGLELEMPRPSYTIDTLHRLHELHPENRYRIIIGSDNWLAFNRWRSSDEIISEFGVIVYPRPGYDMPSETLPDGVEFIEAPTVNISSTFIRQQIADGFDMNIFLPRGVYSYIKSNQLYY